MEFFKKYFNDVDFNGRSGEVKVHCPFHDDTNASASINVDDNLFHCWVCGVGYNEAGFISRLNNIPPIEATKVLSKLEDTQTSQWGILQQAELWSDAEFLDKVRELGVSDSTIEKLNLGLSSDIMGKKMLGIPIFYNGVVMDIRRYNLLKLPDTPKLIGNPHTEIGYVFPFDLWKSDKSKTYLVEGEKDAIIARELGLNAITLTGGAGATPNDLVFPEFKGRDIIICYDNDSAGRSGANNVFKKLYGHANSIKYINISDIVKKEKEDFYDAVHTYGMDSFTFSLLEEHDFDPAILRERKHYTTIKNALSKNKIKNHLHSIVNVSAEFSDFYALPIVVTLEKTNDDGTKKGNEIELGTKRTWYFDKSAQISTMLELIEVNAKKGIVNAKLKQLAGFPSDEKLSVHVNQYETVYKYKIIDSNSRTVDGEEEYDNTTLDIYTFQKMNVGTEYDIDYIILPHPEKNQRLAAVAYKVVELNADVDFMIDKELLKPFIFKGSVAEKVHHLYNSAKHHIAKHLNYHMWLMEDLVFNSILEINYGIKTWGALDVFILGDTATGKSESSKGLVDLYNFGHFLSLKTSTTIGLIGGSKKDGEGMVNTIGAIPRQHKKLVVMEEFSGADPSFIKTMTDVRTSRRVHIVRVSGELDVACNTRMITLSNPIGDERGLPKYLSTFPNGVMPLMELINNPEDVGRYDGYLLVPQVTSRFNPFLVKLEGEPIPKQSYEHKSQWVYTRRASNVIMSDEVAAYIWEKAEELNSKYECNFPLFGTKAPLKLARFSVALASLIMNVDESFENIHVTKEIVDFVMRFFDEIYDNKVFKLREYKEEYDAYNVCNTSDVIELQELYPKNSNIIEYMEHTSVTSLDNLRANSGYDSKEFNALYAILSQLRFIRSVGKSVIPTAKFRAAIKQIDKRFTTSTGSLAHRKTHEIKE